MTLRILLFATTICVLTKGNITPVSKSIAQVFPNARRQSEYEEFYSSNSFEPLFADDSKLFKYLEPGRYNIQWTLRNWKLTPLDERSPLVGITEASSLHSSSWSVIYDPRPEYSPMFYLKNNDGRYLGMIQEVEKAGRVIYKPGMVDLFRNAQGFEAFFDYKQVGKELENVYIKAAGLLVNVWLSVVRKDEFYWKLSYKSTNDPASSFILEAEAKEEQPPSSTVPMRYVRQNFFYKTIHS